MGLASFFICVSISFLLLSMFFLLGKSNKYEKGMSTGFECGFSSYFFSRFSFSIQFFLIGMIFLFLDLELCVIFPLFFNPSAFYSVSSNLFYMVLILLLGLLVEWISNKLDWVN